MKEVKTFEFQIKDLSFEGFMHWMDGFEQIYGSGFQSKINMAAMWDLGKDMVIGRIPHGAIHYISNPEFWEPNNQKGQEMMDLICFTWPDKVRNGEDTFVIELAMFDNDVLNHWYDWEKSHSLTTQDDINELYMGDGFQMAFFTPEMLREYVVQEHPDLSACYGYDKMTY